MVRILKKFSILLLFFLLMLAGYLGITKLTAGTKISINWANEPSPVTHRIAGEQTETLSYSAWIPDWANKEGLESLENFPGKFTCLSPVWYEVKEDGSLLSKKPDDISAYKNYLKQDQGKLIPTIALFDHEIFSGILQDPVNFQRHIEAIMQIVDSNNYDGIDLDYESTKLADKEKYFELLARLSTLLHLEKKYLIVSVLAKWGDDVQYPSLPETRQVQDWQRISGLADQIRIMAYDYTYAKSQFPGPIAPLDWIKDILAYAVQKIPREKIILGVHLYAYEWWLEIDPGNTNQEFSTLTFLANYLLNNSSDKAARSYTFATVQRVLQEYQGKKSEYQGEQIFTYQKINKSTGKKENRMLVYIDQQGIREREQLAKEFGIAGVVFWRLGGESNLLEQAKPVK